ncbi:MAG: DUF4352 domain-containing protein [Pseudomonadota bacterium]|nr:DUF4352 domain-containing protein [Pseudomonadota bacterium]
MRKKHNHRIFVFICIIASLVLATLACGTSDEPELVATSEPEEETAAEEADTPDEPVSEGEVEPTPANFEIGDTISIGDRTVIVLGWENIPPDEFFTPDEGFKYIGVELVIVNTGETPKSTSSILQMKVKDETAQQYTVDFMAQSQLKGGNVEGELISGEKIRGKVGFQVPEDVQSLELVFDAEVFGTGKVFVNLGSEPKMVEAPSEIPGEKELETYSIGESIEMNDMVLTVNEVSSPAGDQFTKPSEGYKFLVVDLTLINNSSTAVNISSLMQMFVKDSAGRKFDVDIWATTAGGGTTPDGEYAPGETIRGQVGYEVPADETQFIFVFEADFWGTGKILVDLPLE